MNGIRLTRTGGPPVPAPSDLEQAILGEDVVFNALEVAAETGVDASTRRAGSGGPSASPTAAASAPSPRPTPTPSRRCCGWSTAGVIDFDMAVNLTRAVGQTMARLADWEVATLVHRVQELEAGDDATGSPGHDRAADGRRAERAVRGAAGLRLAAPPGRGREPGRGARRQRGGPPHDPGDRRVRRHRRLHRPHQPARPRPDRRPGRDLRVALRRRRRRPARPGDQEHRRRGALRERGPDPRPTTPPRGSSPSSAATRGCPTSGSGWPAARS